MGEEVYTKLTFLSLANPPRILEITEDLLEKDAKVCSMMEAMTPMVRVVHADPSFFVAENC
jgi:hypothetical protein